MKTTLRVISISIVLAAGMTACKGGGGSNSRGSDGSASNGGVSNTRGGASRGSDNSSRGRATGGAAREETAEEFIVRNYEQIREQAALGKGETLHAASRKLLDSKSARTRFKRALKKQHKKIFKASAQKSARRMIELADDY